MCKIQRRQRRTPWFQSHLMLFDFDVGTADHIICFWLSQTSTVVTCK